MNKFIEFFNSAVDTKVLLQTVTVTWQGMVAIFAVMAAIALLVFLFTTISSKKK